MNQNILKNFNNTIAVTFITSFLSLFTLSTNASDIDLQDVEKALGVKVKSECKKPPCPVDVNALLDKLTHEHAKEHKTSKLTDTPQAIESSFDEDGTSRTNCTK